MKVIIKEKEYEYNSDFPHGWNFSKGDYFKIIRLNGNKCFVKRFEVKSSENISGWQLMQKIKGKNEKNLARLYDITETQEKNNNVYYVFYESIDGETLHSIISKKAEINFTTLTEDLFTAIYSLQEKDYWFADFTEKNIYCNEKGRFILIDLDSTQPLAVAPNNEIWGDKQYWILVFNFYKKILHNHQLSMSDINGTLLNYLSIIFLVLRLKIYYSSNEKEYYSQELYDELPLALNNISPAFKLLFDKLFKNNSHSIDETNIASIKKLIEENIINSSSSSHIEPIINEFKITGYLERNENNYTIEPKKSFSLHWNVKDALHVELFKNNEPYKVLNTDKQDILFEESFDNEKEIKYTLTAYNNDLDKIHQSLIIVPNPVPFIDDFVIGNYYEKHNEHYTVEAGKIFSLNWNINNASRIELYKNGKLYKKFSSDKKNIQLTIDKDESGVKQDEYFVIAINGGTSVKSNCLYITIAELQPVINYFTVSNYIKKNGDNYIVENSKLFLLKWSVKNASELKLYKDGTLFKQLDANTESIELVEEVYDVKEKEIEYRLEATNKINALSNTVIIKFIHVAPVINEFKADQYAVKNGKPFNLKWNISNAAVIELYKNSELYQTFINGENSLQLTEEAYDNRQRNIAYSLIAINGALDAKSNQIIIVVKANEGAPKFIKPAAIVLTSLILLLLFWKLVIPLFKPISIPLKDSTSLNKPDTVKSTSEVASLPPSLNEIWQSNSGKHLVNINIPQKLIYYSTGNNQYLNESIKSVYKVDAGGYKINVATTEGDKVLLVKNITQQSFSLSVCDAAQANCSDSENMHLYYKPDVSFIYLPVVNNTANDLQPSEKNKLYKFIKSSKDSFTVNAFCSKNFIGSSNINSALNVLNAENIHYTVSQQNINTLNPFQRDYITIARKAASTVNTETTNVPDCNKIFYSISQTKKLASPLIVCKLDLSKASITTIPQEVYEFTNLHELTLTQNNVSDDEISKLKTALPECIIKYVAPKIVNDNENNIVATNKRSLGYLQFDEYDQLTDNSKELLNKIVDRLLQDTSAKIIFLSKWTGGDQNQLRIQTNHITIFVRYLQSAGIKSSNKQVSSEVTRSNNEDVNKVHIVGVNFPSKF